MDETAEGPVDLAVALRWLGGDQGLLRELVGIFVDDGPKRLQAIRAAHDRGRRPADRARRAQPERLRGHPGGDATADGGAGARGRGARRSHRKRRPISWRTSRARSIASSRSSPTRPGRTGWTSRRRRESADRRRRADRPSPARGVPDRLGLPGRRRPPAASRPGRSSRSADPPALAILDWTMPGMDGLELCTRIRTLGREPKPYLIFVTAKARTQDIVDRPRRGRRRLHRQALRARGAARARPGGLPHARAPGGARRSGARARRSAHRGSSSSRGSFRSARTARRCATTRTTGSRSRRTSRGTRTHSSRTESVPECRAEVRRAGARPAAQDPRGPRPRAVIARVGPRPAGISTSAGSTPFTRSRSASTTTRIRWGSAPSAF